MSAEAGASGGGGGDAALLKRYRRATQRRLDSLLDEGKRDGRILAQEEGEPAYNVVQEQLPREALVGAVQKFVGAHIPMPGAAVVSLSGGVDSMVLCQVLCYLRDYPRLSHPAASSAPTRRRGSGDVSRRGPAHVDARGRGGSPERAQSDGRGEDTEARLLHTVAAVHVDYGNRRESGEEAKFLEAWCRARGIQWFSTRAQVQRGAGDREAYEAETRELRFALYRSALEATGARGVMLGHHRGDVEENVISNVMKGVSVLALGGMHAVQYMSQFQVQVQRPLLALDKAEILDFATRYGVPYFKDTTPSWSTRGRLRRKLVPLLQDVYGDGVLSKLSSLAAEADEMNSLLDMSLFAPFHAAVIEGAAGACVTRESFDVYIEYPIAFWKRVLRHVCLRVGAEVPREGAVKQMLDRQRKALGLERWQWAPAPSERRKESTNSSSDSRRSARQGDKEARDQTEDRKGGDEAGGCAETRATWLQARQHSRTLLYGGGLYILNPALFPASPGGGDGVWWQRGQRLIVGRSYLLGSWNITLALLRVDEEFASSDSKRSMETGTVQQHWREYIGKTLGSWACSAKDVDEGEERRGGYSPVGVAMTMMDVVMGLLVYELPLVGWCGEDEAEELSGDGDNGSGGQEDGSGVVAWEIQPFARIAACRLIPREVRALLPIVAPVGAPTTQQQERRLSRHGVSRAPSRRQGSTPHGEGGDGNVLQDVGAALMPVRETPVRSSSLARILGVRRSPGPPMLERETGAGRSQERRGGSLKEGESERGESVEGRISDEMERSCRPQTEVEEGSQIRAGKGRRARFKVRVTLRAVLD